MSRMSVRRTTFLVAGVLALVAVETHAGINAGQTIGIDFGSISPAAGLNFNNYSDVTIADGATESFSGTLVDTDGSTVDGVGFSVQNNTGQATGRALASSGTEGYGLMTNSTVYSDWLISNNTSGNPLDAGAYLVFTFTGLDDSLVYDLTGGFDSNNDNFNATWSADGQSFTSDTTGDVGYGTLEGLTTDGVGNLEIRVTRSILHVTAAGLTLTAVTPPIEPGDVVGLDFGDTPPANHFNDISANGTYSVLKRLSDGTPVAGISVTVAGPTFYKGTGPNDSLAGLSSD